MSTTTQRPTFSHLESALEQIIRYIESGEKEEMMETQINFFLTRLPMFFDDLEEFLSQSSRELRTVFDVLESAWIAKMLVGEHAEANQLMISMLNVGQITSDMMHSLGKDAEMEEWLAEKEKNRNRPIEEEVQRRSEKNGQSK